MIKDWVCKECARTEPQSIRDNEKGNNCCPKCGFEEKKQLKDEVEDK